MMKPTYSEIGPDIKEQAGGLPLSITPEMPQPALSAFDQLNYVYGAIAANCFLELEALR
ncbi:hypothetical protein C1752_00682 [Acaryochloris thomasi RCC1774]|uniref:Uncharacterized protein n=2 Tax=Acaryochloris TaxID=155977 RepID=A0A2W1K5F1_9CYAN|nr:hypothetical protein C1752_00682 [Acaryochloris thomasi RCC1774]